ncbi:hypothetical protein B9Z65_7994 [Elsinoe australis]|uniref:Uncharacterized protein n=1 Tax=Elsinoe australis TaxID=40998 RepID=A0A2P7YVR7_9PEZI|nr:hypothetical protein B9Z65_7994 [Elsinoe australis]
MAHPDPLANPPLDQHQHFRHSAGHAQFHSLFGTAHTTVRQYRSNGQSTAHTSLIDMWVAMYQLLWGLADINSICHTITTGIVNARGVLISMQTEAEMYYDSVGVLVEMCCRSQQEMEAVSVTATQWWNAWEYARRENEGLRREVDGMRGEMERLLTESMGLTTRIGELASENARLRNEKDELRQSVPTLAGAERDEEDEEEE